MFNRSQKNSQIIPFPLERVSKSRGVLEVSGEIIILPVIRYEYDTPTPAKKRRLKSA